MTERVGAPRVSREMIRDGLGIAALGTAAALTAGAAAIPTALARGWLGKQALNVGTDVLSKTLLRVR